jgi:type II secretory pathway pseudopilin PulG
MIRARQAFALPAVIAATIILAGLATLANATAVAALRESRALRDAATAAAANETLRARALVHLRGRSRAEVMAGPAPLGEGDTSVAVTPLAWPWHRVVVSAGGFALVADFARARVPRTPWCAAAVYGTTGSVAPNTVFPPPPGGCVDHLLVPPESVVELDSALAADLHVGAPPDTVLVTSSVHGVIRAGALIEVTGSVTVSGLLIAPAVRIASGARVRGVVAARDALVVMAGAVVFGDIDAASSAMGALAVVRPLGRRGFHLRP